ncbi:hypothetical protein CR513_03312, partial [Mucuna pruriens]
MSQNHRGGAISWKSVKQTLSATSTMEEEYVAYYEATSQAMILSGFKLNPGILYFLLNNVPTL